MVTRTAEEAKKHNIEKMGDPLGEQYSALWQEIVRLHSDWSEYVELFGKKPERITLLNQAASSFFRLVQDGLWEATLLHIARLTDPPNSLGQKGKSNLTVRNLPNLIDDAATKAKVEKLIEDALKQASFCRDWRNRRIAHRDLGLALDQPATPLENGSRQQVKAVLETFSAILNTVQTHYLESETTFDFVAAHHGALSLLHVIHSGLKASEQRRERRPKGGYLEEEFPRDI
ncbi:hypothetical protein [Tardiphaga sp. OK245]|uniref:AbiU2 domain-containing protein n=1 Tax=Tardiphaga sp. OK245 TaxID=1855306 RepID=UPI0008A7291A|nr:hypothetical protein [Tardiphaga sp. OK245]SEH40384.1 hypothetical protein SAMN05216367_0040 [Tardiphaga sp. OK245]